MLDCFSDMQPIPMLTHFLISETRLPIIYLTMDKFVIMNRMKKKKKKMHTHAIHVWHYPTFCLVFQGTSVNTH